MIENHPHDTDVADDHQMLESVGQTVPTTPSDGACDASTCPTASSQGSLKESIQTRSKAQPALGNDTSALLGLELPVIENTAENPTLEVDSNCQPMLAPLLGTIASQSTEKSGKSSKRRSPERFCYENLLRKSRSSLPANHSKTVIVERLDC